MTQINQLKESVRHPDFQTIYNNFVNQYGTAEAIHNYQLFIKKNGLDESKPYDVAKQYLSESFTWVRPTTVEELNSKDPSGSYYKMKAITANMSMNKNDYRNVETLMQRASSLSYRPLNYDHDHNQWLPFPDYRIHYAAYENKAVECIIRVPKDSKTDQELKEGQIVHPSIEGFPLEGYGKMNGESFNPETYTFVGAALLHKGEQLPGDPLTTIDPLTESVHSWVTPITESIGNSLVESLNNRGEKLKEELTSQPQQSVSGTGSLASSNVSVPQQSPGTPIMPQVTPPDYGKPTSEKGEAQVPTDVSMKTECGLDDSPDNSVLENYLKQNTELKRAQAQNISEVSEARSKLSIETQDHASTKRKLQEALGKNSALEKQVLELLDNKAALDKQVNTLLTEKASLEGQVSAKTREVTTLNRQLNESRSEYQKIVNEQADLKESHSHNLHELNKVSGNTLTLQKENAQLKESQLNNQKEITRLSEELAHVTRENADLTEQRATNAKNLYSLEKQNAEQRTTITELNEKLHKAAGIARQIKIVL